MRDERIDRTKPVGSNPADSTERVIIRELRQRAQSRVKSRSRWGLRLGIGDDCALLSARPGEELAVTTDLSISGCHFRLEWHPPESVGHRALARGLSDLAAMGARPVAVFLSLGLPRELTQHAGQATIKSRQTSGTNSHTWMSRFLNGLLELADAHQVPLAGGDLAESTLAIADIVLVGAVPLGRAMLRSGASPGDQIYVTGWLGGAAAGLGQLVASGSIKRKKTIKMESTSALGRHLFPQPRIAQGLSLQRRRIATAAIDLSDGLSTDLAHVCEESGVAAEVDAALIPIHPHATLNQALHGGEDYELLFTASASKPVPRSVAGVAITRIGRILKHRRGQPAVTIISGNKGEPLEPRGWQHFS